MIIFQERVIMKSYKFLEKISEYEKSLKTAYINNIYKNANLTYKQLLEYSDKLAYYIQERLGYDKTPIVVYGHKHPFMLVYFLACVKSGRAFCPVDTNTPKERVEEIVDTVNTKLVLITEDIKLECETLSVEYAEKIIATGKNRINSKYYVQDEDIYYIIFTSGSTGKPKGVCITYNNLNNFLKWYTGYYKDKTELTFLGHPPFSFDLSVMSLWPALFLGATLIQIDRKHQENFKDMFIELSSSQADIWISTPSFIEMCFMDERFNYNLLPKIEQFIFCGEKLFSTTVEKIHKKFPNSQVINTYGPTESTVMVTWIEITEEINKKYSTNLPVGVIKPKSQVEIVNPDTNGKGEIVIIGDTVAKGYFKNEKITKEKFSTKKINNTVHRSYRTGDMGYFEDGFLFCEGRMDFQVKLHGHRIELEDIDANLLKNKKIRQAATIPNYKDEKVHSLTTYIVYGENIEQRFEVIKKIKSELKKLVPDYMIPKKIIFLDEMPLNNNGKIDKKKLKGM